jgi:purine-binding chemotaxis protein CheW
MSMARIETRAQALRREFDEAFARPPAPRSSDAVNLLGIRIAGEPCALPMRAVAGVFADKRPTRLPGTAPEFLGLAGFRSSMVPVFDLRVLLGHAGGPAPRWLVVASAAPVALAFDALDGTLRVPPSAIIPRQASDAGQKAAHVSELVRGEGLRFLVDMDSVVAEIRRRVGRDNNIAQE